MSALEMCGMEITSVAATYVAPIRNTPLLITFLRQLLCHFLGLGNFDGELQASGARIGRAEHVACFSFLQGYVP